MRELSDLERQKLAKGLCPACGGKPEAYCVKQVVFTLAHIELGCCGIELVVVHPHVVGWPQDMVRLTVARIDDDLPKLIGESSSVEARAQAAAWQMWPRRANAISA